MIRRQDYKVFKNKKWRIKNLESEADILIPYPISITLADGAVPTIDNEAGLDAALETCFNDDFGRRSQKGASKYPGWATFKTPLSSLICRLRGIVLAVINKQAPPFAKLAANSFRR